MFLASKLLNEQTNRKLWRMPIIKETPEKPNAGIHSTASTLLRSLYVSRSNSLHDGAPLGHNVRQLSFKRGDRVADIVELLFLCPFVETLTPSHHDVTDTGMERIYQSCPHLKKISLEGLSKVTIQTV